MLGKARLLNRQPSAPSAAAPARMIAWLQVGPPYDSSYALSALRLEGVEELWDRGKNHFGLCPASYSILQKSCGTEGWAGRGGAGRGGELWGCLPQRVPSSGAHTARQAWEHCAQPARQQVPTQSPLMNE